MLSKPKTFLILVAYLFVAQVISSPAQQAGSSKRGRTFRRSRPAALAQPTSAIRQELIQQLIGDDSTVTSSCIDKSGGADRAIQVEPIDLNRDGKVDYVVSGTGGSINMTSTGTMEIVDCLCGARRCHDWLYLNTGAGYKLVFSVKNGGIIPLATYTNGYRDLSVETVLGNSRPVTPIYKFDGTRYQETKQRTGRRR